jgi:alpha-ketoglutaric semialdehyde dehydrogenase
MELHGRNFIGVDLSARGEKVFQASNPATSQKLEPPFHEATEDEIDEALELAEDAFCEAREKRLCVAPLLHALADEILSLGSDLIGRAVAETGLPEARFIGERARTVAQIRMFAELVEEGSWVDARIDRSIPDREPLPKPDLRQMLVPIGPVVVFGASNFPLAFSVPGGDTASALAAGNPVVVKAHPAHPGTSELVATAFRRAISKSNIPAGFFSMLHGAGYDIGISLVRHPRVEAVGFTGSLQGGRALFDEAAARPRPIPVFAEMGSINPVFVLPSALKERAGELAQNLYQSMTLGVGQFCTNPGLVVGLKGAELDELLEKLRALTSACAPATMLHAGIRDAYEAGIKDMSQTAGVGLVSQSVSDPDPLRTEVRATVLTTDAKTFVGNANLSNEVFGPSTLVVTCENVEELGAVAHNLKGHLTGTIHGGPEDLTQHRPLIATLEKKVGRLIFNGVPTGVEVCSSMHHGGPYPATTDARATSVGANAIKRFARPVCYQDFPDDALPPELRNQNERGIWRLVDGEFSRDSIADKR